MRARNIKPGLCSNEILGAAEPIIQLLFACLPMIADRDGKIEDRPLRIKAAIFPYREVKIEPLLSWLEKNGFISRYECQGIKVIYICGFRKHQSPHHTEKVSELPDKPLICNPSGETTVNPPLQDGEYPPDSLIPDSLIPDSAGALAPTVFTGQSFNADERRLSTWAKAYPAINIDREMMAAVAWLQANPKNKKSNYDSFLTRWFSRAQDKAPRQGNFNGNQARANETHQRTGGGSYPSGGGSYGRKEPFKRNVEVIGGKK